MIRIGLGFILLTFTATSASADSFDFSDLTPDGSTLALAEGSFHAIESGSQLAITSAAPTSVAGAICSNTGLGNNDCTGDMRVVFSTPVNKLSFESFLYDFGDLVTLTIISAGVVVETVTVEANAVIELSSTPQITAIEFSDFSANMGLAWGNFSFESEPVALDSDDDGIIDPLDNCILQANADQQDSDNDGYGNRCDFDVNNDCTINFLDVFEFSDAFLGNNLLFDFNSDGSVNFLDFLIMTEDILGVPGPGLGGGTCLSQ